MNQFLAPIFRKHFDQLYRDSYTFIAKAVLIPLESDSVHSDMVQDKLLNHFLCMPPFIYEEDYIILLIEKNNEEDIIEVTVHDIVAIYPFSPRAKVGLTDKLDPRININEPIFEKILNKIVANIQERDNKNGIDTLLKLCNIDSAASELEDLIGKDNIKHGINDRENGKKAAPLIHESYFKLLIAYDRYEPFYDTPLGYFFDSGVIFSYTKGLDESTFLESRYCTLLKTIDKDTDFDEIIRLIDDASETDKFRKELLHKKIKGHVVGPLYLMFRELFRRLNPRVSNNEISNIRKYSKYGKEFEVAVLLLGATFGYFNLYNLDYDSFNLRFFISHIPSDQNSTDHAIQKPSETKNNDINNVLQNDKNDETQVQLNKEISDEETAEPAAKITQEASKSKEICEQLGLYEEDEMKIIRDHITGKLEKKEETIHALLKSLKEKRDPKLTEDSLIKILENMPAVELFTPKKHLKAKLKK